MPKEKKEHDFLIGIKCSCLSNYLLSIFFCQAYILVDSPK